MSLDFLDDFLREIPVIGLSCRPDVDSVEVYKRGKIPSQPIKIYDSTEVEMGRFPNARFAVFGGREEDKKLANEYFIKNEAILLKLLENDFVSEEEKEILKQILV